MSPSEYAEFMALLRGMLAEQKKQTALLESMAADLDVLGQVVSGANMPGRGAYLDVRVVSGD